MQVETTVVGAQACANKCVRFIRGQRPLLQVLLFGQAHILGDAIPVGAHRVREFAAKAVPAFNIACAVQTQ
jgi:hypothetical protein